MITLTVSTNKKTEFIDITGQIQEQISKSGLKDGLLMVYVPHTTAAVTINERMDYFGACVTDVATLLRAPGDGRVVVSDDLLADPVVQTILDERARVRALRLSDSGSHTGPIAIA